MDFLIKVRLVKSDCYQRGRNNYTKKKKIVYYVILTAHQTLTVQGVFY